MYIQIKGLRLNGPLYPGRGTTGMPSGMQDSPAGVKVEHRCSS